MTPKVTILSEGGMGVPAIFTPMKRGKLHRLLITNNTSSAFISLVDCQEGLQLQTFLLRTLANPDEAVKLEDGC